MMLEVDNRQPIFIFCVHYVSNNLYLFLYFETLPLVPCISMLLEQVYHRHILLYISSLNVVHKTIEKSSWNRISHFTIKHVGSVDLLFVRMFIL